MIVVTTPTGQIGSQLLKELLVANQPVRVISRDPAAIPAATRARVEVVQGSHGDAAIVEKAFQGADAVFWLPPPAPKAISVEAAYLDFSRPACDLFRAGAVKHVVGVSSLGRGKPQARHAGQITASLAMDDMIAATGVNYRALAMPSFMDNMLRQVASIQGKGVISAPIPGELKSATCATRDIAVVAAGLLINRSWTGNGDVPVLGPEDLSFNEMARVMSDVLGKTVRFEEMPDGAMESMLLAYGQSEAMARATGELFAAVKDGIYSGEPRVAEPNSPTTFRQWCEDVLKPAVLN